MRIKQDSLQQVLSTADVAEVIGDFVSLKRRGRNLIACCPFHDEKTPSFNVNPERGIYKCFGCGKAGDSVAFVMEIEGLTFVQAIEYLAKKYGIELAYEQGQYDEDTDAAREREALMVALQFAQTWYRKQLTDSAPGQSIALPYLRERGILPHIQEEFGMGWAPDAFDTFSQYALSQGYAPAILEAAGLCLKRDDGSLYDRFRARIMFPIYTPSGRVVGFGGRILGKDLKQAKYVNSPEGLVYQKSKLLYGLWQSRKEIRKQSHVFLTEGYLDVIALHQAGIPRAVASSGTSLTQEQAKLITRYADNVTVLFDGDAAGTKAAMRGIDILLEEGLAVRVLSLPDGHDPDSYLKAHGSEAFLTYNQQHEQDFVAYKAAALLQEAGQDPFKRAEAASEVVRTLTLVPDKLKQDVLIRQAARLLEVPEETLRAEAIRHEKARVLEQSRQAIRENRNQQRQALDLPPGVLPAQNENYQGPDSLDDAAFEQQSPTDTPLGGEPGSLLNPLTPDDLMAIQEREAIRLLLNYGTEPLEDLTLMQYIMRELQSITFASEPAASAMRAIQELLAIGITPGPEHLLSHADAAIRALAQDLVMPKELPSPRWAEKAIEIPELGASAADAAYRHLCWLNLRSVRKNIEKLWPVLAQAGSGAEGEATFREYLDLKATEAALCKELGITVMP